jgi:hypothetical protein
MGTSTWGCLAPPLAAPCDSHDASPEPGPRDGGRCLDPEDMRIWRMTISLEYWSGAVIGCDETCNPGRPLIHWLIRFRIIRPWRRRPLGLPIWDNPRLEGGAFA